MTQSGRFELNRADYIKWGRNALVFLAPFLLVFLIAIQQGTELQQALYLVYLYALNIVIDLLKKFISGK